MTKNYSTTSAVRPKCMLDQHAKNAFVVLVAKSIARLIKLENINYRYTMKTIFPLTLITLFLFGFSSADRSLEIKVDASRTYVHGQAFDLFTSEEKRVAIPTKENP